MLQNNKQVEQVALGVVLVCPLLAHRYDAVGEMENEDLETENYRVRHPPDFGTFGNRLVHDFGCSAGLRLYRSW